MNFLFPPYIYLRQGLDTKSWFAEEHGNEQTVTSVCVRAAHQILTYNAH